MCGRVHARIDAKALSDLFAHPKLRGFRYEKAEQVSPGEWIVIIRPERDERVIDVAGWGFIPSWEKDPRKGHRPFNARSETVATNGLFRKAFRRSRCIVPVTGFYEFVAVPGSSRKHPVLFGAKEGGVLALAGIWDHWTRPAEMPAPEPKGAPKPSYVLELDRQQAFDSVTILTTVPNATVAEVHDRMPVVLPPEAWDAWLDPRNEDVEGLQQWLRPCPEDWVGVVE